MDEMRRVIINLRRRPLAHGGFGRHAGQWMRLAGGQVHEPKGKSEQIAQQRGVACVQVLLVVPDHDVGDGQVAPLIVSRGFGPRVPERLSRENRYEKGRDSVGSSG